MPNCMREGWGNAGVWNSPIGDGQDRQYAQSQRMLTPLHSATRASAPRNALNTGGVSPCSYKVTMGGSQTVPSLSAWAEQDDASNNINLDASCFRKGSNPLPHTGMTAAGGNGVFFGSRPMWGPSMDKKKNQTAYSGGAETPIALQSYGEQQVLEQLGLGRSPELLKWSRKAQGQTPDTATPGATPVSSRPGSSAGSKGSGQRRTRAQPVHDRYSNAAFDSQPAFQRSSPKSAPFQSHCSCFGEAFQDATLLTLPTQQHQNAPHVPLDAMIALHRRRAEIYAGNVHKGSKGTMLGC